MDMRDDENIFELCNNIIRHITDEKYELIVGYLLRELHGNNLIYINLTNKWYEYNEQKKEWKIYNFKKLLLNFENLYIFFNDIMMGYAEHNDDLNCNNKAIVKRISNNIAKYILEGKIKNDELERHSSILFSINENI